MQMKSNDKFSKFILDLDNKEGHSFSQMEYFALAVFFAKCIEEILQPPSDFCRNEHVKVNLTLSTRYTYGSNTPDAHGNAHIVMTSGLLTANDALYLWLHVTNCLFRLLECEPGDGIVGKRPTAEKVFVTDRKGQRVLVNMCQTLVEAKPHELDVIVEQAEWVLQNVVFMDGATFKRNYLYMREYKSDTLASITEAKEFNLYNFMDAKPTVGFHIRNDFALSNMQSNRPGGSKARVNARSRRMSAATPPMRMSPSMNDMVSSPPFSDASAYDYSSSNPLYSDPVPIKQPNYYAPCATVDGCTLKYNVVGLHQMKQNEAMLLKHLLTSSLLTDPQPAMFLSVHPHKRPRCNIKHEGIQGILSKYNSISNLHHVDIQLSCEGDPSEISRSNLRYCPDVGGLAPPEFHTKCNLQKKLAARLPKVNKKTSDVVETKSAASEVDSSGDEEKTDQWSSSQESNQRRPSALPCIALTPKTTHELSKTQHHIALTHLSMLHNRPLRWKTNGMYDSSNAEVRKQQQQHGEYLRTIIDVIQQLPLARKDYSTETLLMERIAKDALSACVFKKPAPLNGVLHKGTYGSVHNIYPDMRDTVMERLVKHIQNLTGWQIGYLQVASTQIKGITGFLFIPQDINLACIYKGSPHRSAVPYIFMPLPSPHGHLYYLCSCKCLGSRCNMMQPHSRNKDYKAKRIIISNQKLLDQVGSFVQDARSIYEYAKKASMQTSPMERVAEVQAVYRQNTLQRRAFASAADPYSPLLTHEQQRQRQQQYRCRHKRASSGKGTHTATMSTVEDDELFSKDIDAILAVMEEGTSRPM